MTRNGNNDPSSSKSTEYEIMGGENSNKIHVQVNISKAAEKMSARSWIIYAQQTVLPENFQLTQCEHHSAEQWYDMFISPFSTTHNEEKDGLLKSVDNTLKW